MKNSLLIIMAAATLLLTGCLSPTKSVVNEYDAAGNLTKVTETSESVAKSIIASTKDKIVLVWDNSFLAYASATAATADAPTPAVKFGIGKADIGLLTAPTGTDPAALAKIVEVTRAADIKVDADGISASAK